MVSLLLIAGLSAQAATCAHPTRATDLQRALNEAMAAYAALDIAAFDRARADATTTLECLGEPVSPPLAAAAHRAEAIAAFVQDDLQGTRSAFRSALVLQPAYRMPEDVLPPGSPLQALYEEARQLGPGPDEPASLAVGLTLLVDGADQGGVPAERPAIVQVVAPDGQVQSTWYLRVGDPFPEELRAPPGAVAVTSPVVSPVMSPVVSSTSGEPDRGGRWMPLAIGAGVSGLLAGGAWALSAASHDRFVTPGEVAYEELEALQRANHAQVLAAGGLGVTALGLGIGAVIVGVW